MAPCVQLCSFVVNYKGKPFMQGLFENKGLLIMLGTALAATFLAASCVLPPLNEVRSARCSAD